jgi:gliding motility associated protien GldN
MKTNILKIVLLGILVTCFSSTVSAQRTKKKRTPTTTAKKKTNSKKTPTKTNDVSMAAAAPMPANDSLPVPMPKASMENDNAIERLLVKDRTPLAYEHLREDDAVYKQRVWRIIDTREKMNESFRYDAEEDNGSQLFINILLTGIQKKDILVYDPIDDRFTTPLKTEDLLKSMVGEAQTRQVPDWNKDPTGNTMKDTIIREMFNPSLITKYQVKEEWIFDKESSRMFVRILGIAPLQDITDPTTGAYRGEKKLFWMYYPKSRAMLAKAEAYNGRNFGARPTWEELFESRMFSSYIVKSTIDNPGNVSLDQIPGLKENGILRLWEGENIKTKIFNYEQNLWSY